MKVYFLIGMRVWGLRRVELFESRAWVELLRSDNRVTQVNRPKGRDLCFQLSMYMCACVAI